MKRPTQSQIAMFPSKRLRIVQAAEIIDKNKCLHGLSEMFSHVDFNIKTIDNDINTIICDVMVGRTSNSIMQGSLMAKMVRRRRFVLILQKMHDIRDWVQSTTKESVVKATTLEQSNRVRTLVDKISNILKVQPSFDTTEECSAVHKLRAIKLSLEVYLNYSTSFQTFFDKSKKDVIDIEKVLTNTSTDLIVSK